MKHIIPIKEVKRSTEVLEFSRNNRESTDQSSYLNSNSLTLPEKQIAKKLSSSSIGIQSTAPSNDIDETGLQELDLEVCDDFSSEFQTSRSYAKT